jgi:hypothetical protein
MSKINYNPVHPPLFPISLAENVCPFEIIALDFITKLLSLEGHNMILTITNTDCLKASIFLPCSETINSEEVALLYASYMVLHYGIPCKVISDQDVCFMSKFTMELC